MYTAPMLAYSEVGNILTEYVFSSVILGGAFFFVLRMFHQNATDRRKSQFLKFAAILCGGDFILGVFPEELGILCLMGECAAMVVMSHKYLNIPLGRSFGVMVTTIAIATVCIMLLMCLFS